MIRVSSHDNRLATGSLLGESVSLLSVTAPKMQIHAVNVKHTTKESIRSENFIATSRSNEPMS